ERARELRMRDADHRLVVRRDLSVAVHVAELDATRRGARLPGRIGFGLRLEVTVCDVPVEGTDRLANLVDDLVAVPGRHRAVEEVLDTVDLQDLVLVVAALQGRVPLVALVAD